MTPQEFKLPNGVLRITETTNPDYPGVDIEFITPENNNGNVASRPRVIIEQPVGENLRVLVFNDSKSEEYTDEIEFPNTAAISETKQ